MSRSPSPATVGPILGPWRPATARGAYALVVLCDFLATAAFHGHGSILDRDLRRLVDREMQWRGTFIVLFHQSRRDLARKFHWGNNFPILLPVVAAFENSNQRVNADAYLQLP